MAKLTIDIPDDLAASLHDHPLPLPVDRYCRQALEEAAVRDAERRLATESWAEAATATIEKALGRGPDDNELFTVAESAQLLRLSPGTVRRLIHEGKLPTAAVGRKHLISRRTITRIIDHLPADDADVSGALESIRRSRLRLR